MKIAVAQLSPTIGAFEANQKAIGDAYLRACDEQARLLLTPELAVCGYAPHDLISRPELLTRTDKVVEGLAKLTVGKSCALLVGHVARNPDPTGKSIQNVVSIFENGKLVFRQAKALLPTYDVFDEARYFEPAHEIKVWNCDGTPVAVAICEDLWASDPTLGGETTSQSQDANRKLYAHDPVAAYKAQGARLVLSLSASPYEWGKAQHRFKVHSEIARSLNAPLAYVNQWGANDEILFDGGSMAIDAKGAIVGTLPSFQSGFGIWDTETNKLKIEAAAEVLKAQNPLDPKDAEIATLHLALVVGIADYFRKTGFSKALLGLSGGIDSAVVAVLAAQALGPKNVLGIAMASQYSSGHSLEDADQLARSLGIRFEVKPIKFLNSQAVRDFSEGRNPLAPLALENLQSRLRGLILMTISNHENSLVLTTGNKSEIAMGYCTLYGDMVGAIAPIGDVLKTRVYELACYINRRFGPLIPERSITKAPSAELRPNQTDQDSLPPYEALDAMLEGYLEQGQTLAELEVSLAPLSKKLGLQSGWIEPVLQLLGRTEYKRRQAAPVLKVSSKAFGLGRRIPIAKRWDP